MSAAFPARCPRPRPSSWNKDQNAPVLDEEIGNAIRVTQGGKVVSERLL
ncbi:hypothetical protein [Sphingobium sp. EM0848]|nr:hypothetical protein [Sphingobium sp. EM0848]